MGRNYKVILLGIGIFTSIYLTYLIMAKTITGLPSFMWYTPHASAIFGGVVIGNKSIESPLRNSVLGGILMAVVVVVINHLSWLLGIPVDFGGPKGSLIFIILSLPMFVVLAVVGGALGSKDEKNETNT